MKVVHIIGGLGDGGAEAVLFRLCQNSTICRHYVISLNGAGVYGKRLQECGIEVFVFNIREFPHIIFDLYKIWKTIRCIKPDVVQTWLYHADLVGAIISKCAGVKQIYWGIHNTALERKGSNFFTYCAFKLNSFLSLFIPTKIVACAQSAMDTHVNSWYRKDKFHVIRNGYSKSDFYVDRTLGTQYKKKLGIQDSDVVFGMVARFNPIKDHESLLSALSILKSGNKNFKCLLAGNGLDYSNDKVTTLIKKFKLEDVVILLGQSTNVHEVMNALDFHVLSSRAEAFPNVICEAMSCGVPCIATDVGDCRYIISETGWIVPSKDVLSLSSVMQEALDEKLHRLPDWSRRSHACVSRIQENFTVQLMVNSYHDIWLIK